MESGLKRCWRTVRRLECRLEGYGSTIQEVPTARSAAERKRPWLQSCLGVWVQSDDQLQRESKDFFVSRWLRHAQGLQRALRTGEQQFWGGSSQRRTLRL